MHAPLIILCPPRSFSSVVSTIIGEHPELYGFPELHIFVGETVDEIIRREAKASRPGPAGLLRTLAQEHDGIQTNRTILRAIAWLNERRNWTTKELFDYLLELVSPKIGVEKSPNTARNSRCLERVYRMYPEAYFLHLTRHPISARKSIQEFWHHKTSRSSDATTLLTTLLDSMCLWYQMHQNIISFTDTLPVGQTLRVKGEDILSDPEVYLPQIMQWMGRRDDTAAIESMLRPESSPYACIGPAPARGGNDTKFMRSPKMRRGKVKEPSLENFFDEHSHIDWISPEVFTHLDEADMAIASGIDLRDELTELAHVMGYQ